MQKKRSAYKVSALAFEADIAVSGCIPKGAQGRTNGLRKSGTVEPSHMIIMLSGASVPPIDSSDVYIEWLNKQRTAWYLHAAEGHQ